MGGNLSFEKVVPQEVRKVISALKHAGYDAYLVGGAVRDMLLGRVPKDYDVATDALPEEISNLFPRVIPTGVRYGTVTVCGDIRVEVTTFRSDGPYLDARRPKGVRFSHSIEEDLLRRDFTVNALALSETGNVVDYVNGLRDLTELKVIRCVGNPEIRLREDALRMLRAYRFSAQLGSHRKPFEIEQCTKKAIGRNSYLISYVSWERIQQELSRILLSDNPGVLEDMLVTGLLGYILPELAFSRGVRHSPDENHVDVFEHTIVAVENSPKRLRVRLAALLHDIGKARMPCVFRFQENGGIHYCDYCSRSVKTARHVLSRLKFDKRTVNAVCALIEEHTNRTPFSNDHDVKLFVNRVGKHNLEDLFDLERADILASSQHQDLVKVGFLQDQVQRVLESGDPLTLQDLAVNGEDLMNWGMEPGEKLGEMLNGLLTLVLKQPNLNTYDRLKYMFQKMRDADSP